MAEENQIVSYLLGPEFMVKLDDVDPDPSPDEPRIEYKPEKLDEVVAGMKLTGTASDSIKLRKHPDAKRGYKWQRLAGGYRFAAARILGLEELPAKEYMGTPLQAAIYAASDNVNRSGHSTYELAQLFAKTKAKHKLETKQLIELLRDNGFSAKYTEDYVNNLIRGYMKLCDTVSQAWREDRGVSTNMINWLVTYPKKEQEELWTRILVAGKWETVKAEEEAKGTRKKKGPKHDRVILGSSYVHDAISAVSSSPLPKEAKNIAVAVLNWVLGGAQKHIKIGNESITIGKQADLFGVPHKMGETFAKVSKVPVVSVAGKMVTQAEWGVLTPAQRLNWPSMTARNMEVFILRARKALKKRAPKPVSRAELLRKHPAKSEKKARK